MKYLLDTNVCIYIIKRKPPEVLERFRALIPGDMGISSVTLAELQFGVEKSLNPPRNQEALLEFLMALEITLFDEGAARHYGKIRSTLERAGRPIGSMDMLIAAQALDLDVPLVTNNVREFSRVPGLRVENWIEKG